MELEIENDFDNALPIVIVIGRVIAKASAREIGNENEKRVGIDKETVIVIERYKASYIASYYSSVYNRI